MAYALGFPKDVTGRIYSMRDAKNWNGDKYRRGATRDVANWWDKMPMGFRNMDLETTLTVIISDFEPAAICHQDCPKKYEIWGPFDKYTNCVKSRERVLQEQLQEMWWQCEPCEPRSNMRW